MQGDLEMKEYWDKELKLTLTREEIAVTMDAIKEASLFIIDKEGSARRIREYEKILKKIEAQAKEQEE